MFEDYQAIFNERGDAYHSAMKKFPEARRNEFGTLIEQLQPRRGEIICDMPSGGGYLCNYLPDDARLELVETSRAFYERCPSGSDRIRRHLCALDKTSLRNDSIDAVVSLAGLHHVGDLSPIFQEVARILKPGGRCCLADVQDGSAVAKFLNVFVDECNSMGHNGQFFTDRVADLLSEAGIMVIADRVIDYPWVFNKAEDMSIFCTMLFGLNRCDIQEVLRGIREYLGYRVEGGQYLMNWQLRFITGVKA